MLDIYICDDEEPVRREIERIIRNEILIQNYDMQVALSSPDPKEVLDKAREGMHSNIYFLDVDLKGKGMDGFEMGKKIRSFDGQGTIVYITAYGNLSYRTFEYHVGAMDYIVKEDGKKMQAAVAGCLGEVAERLKTQRRREGAEYFTVRFMDKIRHIPLEEIYYFETAPRPHHIFLCAEKEQMEFQGKLSEIEKSLGKCFFRVHRAFLVNLGLIREADLKKNILIMENGKACLVARNRKAMLRKMLEGERVV